MPLSEIYTPPNKWLTRQPCSQCGLPMFLERIEPADEPDHDKRHFACTNCNRTETLVVKYR